MTTAATPQPLQAPTGFSSSTARDNSDHPKTSSTPVRAAAARRHHRQPPIDPLSDRATESLIRKVLLPHEPGDKGRDWDSQARIDELLPPLTSRNDVDLQLYAFLAIILRDFVQAWYNKITPDETFVAEVVHVLAHCTRAVEQRLRGVDLENLIFHEVPEVLDKHIKIYRSTHHDQLSPGVRVNSREAYHALWPLPFMSPAPISGDPITTAKQLKNEAAYRQLLVQAVLTVLLPTEDLENPCLTALVGQIISELIIGNVIANKAAQPWLLYEAVCIAARSVTEKGEGNGRIKSSKGSNPSMETQRKWTVHGLFVSIIQLVMLFISTVRFVFNLIKMSLSLPTRASGSSKRTRDSASASATRDDPAEDSGRTVRKVPVLSFTAWRLVGNVIELPARMPWLNGLLSLGQLGLIHGPGQVANLDGVLDRLLSHQLQLCFSASQLPSILRTLRGSLFPNNAPGTSSLFPPSSDAEFQALRRRAAAALWTLMPSRVGRVYFGGGLRAALGKPTDPGLEEDAIMLDELEGLLDVVGDRYCNKHLMYSLVELILVRLIPELQESGVEELLQERLG
ncbi:hypothetical protein E4U42_005225 [Claviceps africana]|uniref:PXA domain-containing protein n=1 Tax=Claviceps africana TaxID=83212 RepID=A0A8K0J448_9HYPO|nr:hypothetical protein E4U42_005225 [Claviceps africana]